MFSKLVIMASRLTGGAAAAAAGLGGLGISDTREEMSARLHSILADAMVDEDV